MTEAMSPDRQTGGPIRRFANNLGSLLTSTVFERALRFVVYAAVARTLGATSLGQLALAMAVLQLVSKIAVLGIPMLATREVARDPGVTRAYAVQGAILVTLASLVGYLAVWVFTAITDYQTSTYAVIWAVLVGLIPYCWSRITEAILIGLEQARYVALVNIPVNLVQAGVVVYLVGGGHDVVAVAMTFAVTFAASAVLQGVVVAGRSRGPASPDEPSSVEIIRRGGPFLGVQATVVVRNTANTLIISLVLGEAAVGIYSAAQQLRMPLRVVGTAVSTALLPPLSKAYRRAADLFATVADRSIELMVVILLPGTVGLIVIGDDLVDLIFGSTEFGEATSVLRLLAIAALATAIASTMGRVLMAADRELVTLRISVANTAVQILAGLVLTVSFGLNGAAAASLAVAVLNIGQHYIPTKRLVHSLSLFRAVWKPLVASAVMAIALVAMDGIPVLVAVVAGALVYFAAFVVVAVAVAGGWSQFVDRWRLVG